VGTPEQKEIVSLVNDVDVEMENQKLHKVVFVYITRDTYNINMKS